MNETKIAPDGVKVKLMTIKELAATLGLDYLQVSGFITVLKERGGLVASGSKSAAGQRGRASQVFEIPSVVEIQLWNENENAEVVPEVVETQSVVEVISSKTVSSVS